MGDKRGFTLIELLVTMAIIATLLAIAVPRYLGSVDKAKEAVLRENLAAMRDAIDKYYGDTGKYPTDLDTLVQARYLRAVPLDPITESATTWVLTPPPGGSGGDAGVYDVRSGAEGAGRDQKPYGEW